MAMRKRQQKAAGVEAARVALQAGATGADALQTSAVAVKAARGTPEDVVKAAGAAASKLATGKHGEDAAPHIIAQAMSKAVASAATQQGGSAQKAAQMAGRVLKVAGRPKQEANKAATLATSRTALAEGK